MIQEFVLKDYILTSPSQKRIFNWETFLILFTKFFSILLKTHYVESLMHYVASLIH